MRAIEKIVVHCSDSPNSRSEIGAKDIRLWHIKQGWKDIGYHFVITRKGDLELGRDESVAGAHVAGHNSNSLGICLVGRDVFTTEQMATLTALVRGLIYKYKLDKAAVFGHYELDTHGKTCPNINMEKFREKL